MLVCGFLCKGNLNVRRGKWKITGKYHLKCCLSDDFMLFVCIWRCDILAVDIYEEINNFSMMCFAAALPYKKKLVCKYIKTDTPTTYFEEIIFYATKKQRKGRKWVLPSSTFYNINIRYINVCCISKNI